MPLHPVLLDHLNRAVTETAGAAKATRRDAHLPAIEGKVHAVIGMRRVGKTTFLKQLQAEKRRTLQPERAIYLGFDDDRLAELDAGQLSLLVDEYYRRYPELRGRETVYWYLDEIQLVEGWDRFVRRLVDTEQIELVVSGSSAKMLSREVHTSLRGRSMETVIRPFSFREFLRHHEEEPHDEPRLWTPAKRSGVERQFARYLKNGGFPEAQRLDTPTRVALLQGYVDSVLFRDVIERHEVSQVAALRWLVRFVLRNPAGKISVRKLHDDLRSLGLVVSRDTVSTLLDYIVDAFLIDIVGLATDSERKLNTNPKVAYPLDTGLIQAFDASGRKQTGRRLETAVMNELARRGSEVSYVKTEEGFEVDFLVRDYERREELIQVCADLTSPVTFERELRALQAASDAHPQARQTLIVLDRYVGPSVEPSTVQIRPAYEWLLEVVET